LGPWTNPFSEHPLFHAVVDQWSVTAEDNGTKQALTVKTTLKRSTDHPLTIGADWSATVPTDELTLDARNLGSRAVKVGIILVTEDDRRITSPLQVIEPDSQQTREWVRGRYETEEHLQAAWKDPVVTFASAMPPTPLEIAANSQNDFVGASRRCHIADWWRFLSDLTADTIEHFSRIVKQESQNDWLCGAFYGYVLQFHEPRILTAGHLAIDRLTRSPYADYFFSPALYSHRSLKPGGYSTFMSLVDSYHVNGKLWCNENDLRTFRVMDVPNVKADQIDRRQTPEETIALLRRQLGAVLTRGCGHSYFDMSGGWYDDPRLAEEIRLQVALANRVLEMDRSSASEVAVVIDPDAFTSQALHTQANTWLILGQIASLGSMGFPFGALAKRAGVHAYVNEDAVVYANNSLLSVTVDDPGRRTIRLRRPSTIEDGFTGETLGRDTSELDVEFGERQSRLFLLTH
jgi:hypothetical protein